jgi:2'-5' RNA ligase
MDIPEDVRSAIREFVARLASECKEARGARWARVEGMHVTLKFIGEVSDEKAAQVRKELAGVRLSGGAGAAVEMNFRGVGFFQNAKHPRVFWADIEATPNLAELAAQIEERMERLGIPSEKRAFHPHLTLARFKSEEGLPCLREAIAKAGAMDFGSTRTSEFHLYQSKLLRAGAMYTKLETFSIAAASGKENDE